MLEIKLPYYPQMQAYAKKTRFGVIEITTPTVYEKPIDGMLIARIDTLEAIRDLVGDECMLARNTTYSIVSGSCDEETYRARMSRYYSKHKKFMCFANNVYEHGDNNVSLNCQISRQLLDVTEAFYKDIVNKLDSIGGKYLTTTHLYVYYKFTENTTIPDIRGLKVIC